jgi:hypothetical protein
MQSHRPVRTLIMAVFWVVAQYFLVKLYRRFRRLMMEAAGASGTSENFYQTKRRYSPKDNHLHTRRRKTLKSYLVQHLSVRICS